MEQPNFWSGKEWLARGLTNGLFGAAFLWVFWVPFITFLAVPVASAMMKQYMCQTINQIPAPTKPTIPGSQFAANYLVNEDPTEIKKLNTSSTLSLWFLGGMCILLNITLAISIIRSSGMNFMDVFLLNLSMFIFIVTMELMFFMFIGMHFIPFNIVNMVNGIIDDSISDINNMIPAGN